MKTLFIALFASVIAFTGSAFAHSHGDSAYANSGVSAGGVSAGGSYSHEGYPNGGASATFNASGAEDWSSASSCSSYCYGGDVVTDAQTGGSSYNATGSLGFGHSWSESSGGADYYGDAGAEAWRNSHGYGY